MKITLDWLHTVALLGALNALLLAGVLVVRRRNRAANRILAVAVVAFSIYLMASVYYGAGLVPAFPHFYGASYLLPFLYGPLIYLYARTAGDRARGLTRWDALHIVPFLVGLVAMLPIYLMSGADKIALFEALRRGERPVVLQVLDPLELLSGVIYVTITLLFLKRHRARIKDSYSSLDHVNLQWLMRLVVASGGVWLVAVALQLVRYLQGPVHGGDDLIALGIALLVYGIGYMALRQPEIFRFDTAEYPVRVSQPDQPPVGVRPAFAPEPRPVTGTDPVGSRYERSGLSEREAAALKGALLSAMDRERPWQDSDLTLADLASRLSTTPHKLSEVLNSQLEQSFYDFVNGYRVRYVQRRIGDEEARNFKILSLALDAGFASKSTFNDVFKKHTGQTPSAYRRSVTM